MLGTFGRVIAALVLVGLLGAVGVSIYQAGFVAGAAAEGTTVVAPYAYGWGYGIGHGFFGFFGTLIVIFIIFGLLRAIFWRGPRWGGGWGGGWGYGHHGYGKPDGFRGSPWEDRAREVHDDWHRRQGGETSPGGSGTSSGASGSGGTGSSPS